MKNLHVVVGIIFNEKKEVLIALRPPHVVQPGLWEFPGGKVEEDETLENALIREFREEIGIEVQRAKFLLKIEKPFLKKNILLILHTYLICTFQGVPRGCENQIIRWVPVNTLNQYTFPDANAEIVLMLKSMR